MVPFLVEIIVIIRHLLYSRQIIVTLSHRGRKRAFKVCSLKRCCIRIEMKILLLGRKITAAHWALQQKLSLNMFSKAAAPALNNGCVCMFEMFWSPARAYIFDYMRSWYWKYQRLTDNDYKMLQCWEMCTVKKGTHLKIISFAKSFTLLVE